MKHLLNGVAIAAAFAIAAPVWAQAPTTPGSSAPNAAAPAGPKTSTQRHKRMPMPHHVSKAAGDAMTDQLNREELARIQGGAPPPAPMTSSSVPGQPSLTKGIPKAGSPSPSAPTP